MADLEIVRNLAVARVRIMLGVIDVADGRLDGNALQTIKHECECILAALAELDVFRNAPLAEPA